MRTRNHKGRYLVVDKEYGIYHTAVFNGYLRAQVKKGNLSVLNLRTMQGMNIDGWTMEDIPELPKGYLVESEPLTSV